ncbi:MAG: carbon-nitrogen hydrolase family protein [Bryobacterales bacterium]
MPALLWMLVLALTAAALPLAAAPLHVEESAFRATPEGPPPGWTSWAARPEIAPRTYVDEIRYRSLPGSLAISGGSNAAVYGGWHHQVAGVEPGKWYRLTAYYQTEGITDEALKIVARLDWQTTGNRRAGHPEYAYRVAVEPTPGGSATVKTAGHSSHGSPTASAPGISTSADWKRLTLEAPAPEKAAAVAIQLYLNNAPQATVWWDDITLEEIKKPGPRQATVAVVHLRPRDTKSREASVKAFIDLVEKDVRPGTDIILLPEGITVVGTGKTYADVAEPLPGPTTNSLSEIARKKNAWIVAGLIEREAPAMYNTAVLIDRQGRLAGKYRKVYLPREEIEGGLTPGTDYPVFNTDFGRIGMMICWDTQYADPARALALRGAELILMPIWGGNETLAKARAIENRVFLATSGYDYPTHILDPDGETLAIAPDASGSVAHATIDLNRRYVDEWLGDMRGRFFHELRTDVPANHPANRP